MEHPHTTRHFVRAGIIATIGPASDSPDTLRRLIEAGARVFRFNLSHGSVDDHARRLHTVRSVAGSLDLPVACLADLPGPKIRVGTLPDPGFDLHPGDTVLISPAAQPASSGTPGNRTVTLPCTYPPIVDEVEPGQRVLINDGMIRLLATDSLPDHNALRCVVTTGGTVTSKKGINLPETDVSAPALSEQDRTRVAWAVQHGFDFLALSFVKDADDVLQLKSMLEGICARDRSVADPDFGGPSATAVVAKIERPQALRNIDPIVQAADAVMVARGDLGVEMDIAQVPIAQKHIIDVCQQWGRPSIVATQMLESMIQHPTPTRAEATDIANAIFDGADCLMLSAETATGKHPVLAVETMRRIIEAAELRLRQNPPKPGNPARLALQRNPTASLAHGAWHVANDLDAAIIACWSQAGGTARYLSQNDFRVPIVAYSSNPRATRRMALLPGVIPLHAQPPKSGLVADWVSFANRDLLDRRLAQPGDIGVLLAGRPVGHRFATNSLVIHRFA